ncbi:Mpv17 / PMP22 family [Popillia japonica]|uniref:Mitochondrial inner membrane protein Mpv17 n=1 Tax=Popillia japonica TaxID=7064 RepID=A0AAW1JIU2_POPJA
MRILLQFYKRVLNKHPVLTQTIQVGVVMGGGDVISQVVVEKKSYKEYNFLRTAQFSSVGLCFLGPTLTMWYRLLAKYVGMKGSLVTVKKVALDQLLFAPFCIAGLMSVLFTIQGQPPKQTINIIKKDYTDILIANYKLWPAVQLVNFYIVPLNYQTLVVQCVALLWNTYISWKTQPQRRPMNNE